MRAAMRMVYDALRGEVVLFGGSVFPTVYDDTWTWDGSNWQLESPPASPPARAYEGLAYDEVRGNAVIFGGQYIWLLQRHLGMGRDNLDAAVPGHLTVRTQLVGDGLRRCSREGRPVRRGDIRWHSARGHVDVGRRNLAIAGCERRTLGHKPEVWRSVGGHHQHGADGDAH